MMFAFVDKEIPKHASLEAIFGEHTLDSVTNHLSWRHAFEGDMLLSAGIPCMHCVSFLVGFFAGEGDFLGVDDDDSCPEVPLGSEVGQMLTPQQTRHLGGKSSQGYACRIYEEPLPRAPFRRDPGRAICR